ncbi:hypothetical protein H5410_011009 [Solanum commersonii]|uniref:Cupin type-1 domain-containing protein n=1 Tax=Solanum commersonii TaxID=4109 RepID=A0A9J6AP03_SOLCO|nr:hypothetical protein H5410_011009 [Solanum commersonii]
MAVLSSMSHASDPSPLQDFCVAVDDSKNAGKLKLRLNVNNLAGLNTLGISLARIDFAPYGLNPPHTHPRGTEVLALFEGTLYVGFVLSNPGPNMKNKLFTKILHPGDVQNPGVITIANAVFGSDQSINDDVLAKAFQIENKVVDYLQSQFWWDNN